jgi:UDP-glucose 4-epimerase
MKVLVNGGTGESDYIHVMNLANVHIKALHCQANLDPFEVLNVGNGQGTTVLELINSFQEVSGTSVKYQLYPRRNGDLRAFWADTSFVFENLAWKPKSTINQMCEDTWRWHINNITGYDVDNSNNAKTSHLNPKDKLNAKN